MQRPLELFDFIPLMRRRRLFGLAAASVCMSGVALAHNAVGFVNPPQMPPRTRVQSHLGRATPLAALFNGKVTALQLMFTGCSATCPIQGALFASVQEKLLALSAPIQSAQLISFSIDPMGDGPRELRQWLKTFDAGKQWLGLTPNLKDLDPFLDFLQGRAKNSDRHTGQVYFFDHKGQLALRSTDFPPADLVVQRLKELAARP